jgi:hypothetical protein
MNKVDIIIATPGHSVMSSYVNSLFSLASVFSDMGISWLWSSQYSSHVADAREMTLSGGSHNIINESRPFNGNIDYNKIMWIDSDISFMPEDVLKLINSDKDITTGAYLLGTGEVTVYKELLGGGYSYEEILKMKEPIKVGGCGFGFVAIKKGVFESLSRPWFQSVLIKTKDDFEFPLMGEDLSFCKRATDLGYEIWFDPTVRVTHHKTMKLTWEGIQP